MAGDIAVQVSIGCNQHIVSDCNFTNHRRINPNPYPITYRWNSLPNPPVFSANCNSFMDITILPNYNFIVNRYSIRVSNIQARPYRDRVIKFYSVFLTAFQKEVMPHSSLHSSGILAFPEQIQPLFHIAINLSVPISL